MPDFGETELFFGNFGLPQWDQERQEWWFPRQNRHQNEFRALESAREVLDAARSGEDEEITRPTDALAREWRRFALENPEIDLGVTSCLLEDDAKSSLARDVALESRPQAKDSTEVTAGQLAFGYAISTTVARTSAGIPKVPIVVTTAGAGGSLLRIALEHFEKIHVTPFEIKYTTPFNGEVGWWMGQNSPIRQITVGDLLAVRYADRILLLRVTLCSQMVQSYGPGAMLPPSRFEVHTLTSISSAECSFSGPMTDLTFCPFSQQRLALVDDAGNWCCWELSKSRGRRKNDSCKKDRYGGGSGMDESSKILWLSEDQIIMSKHNLYQVGHDTKVVLTLDHDERFLDIQQGQISYDHIFALTSKKIIWLWAHPAIDSLLSWQHYLSSSQQPHMAILEQNTATFDLFLYASRECCVYQFEFDAVSSRGCSTEDPHLIQLANDKEIFEINVRATETPQIMQLSILHQDLSLSQILVTKGPHDIVTALTCDLQSRHINERKVQRKSAATISDDFIVSDHDSDDLHPVVLKTKIPGKKYGFLNLEHLVERTSLSRPGTPSWEEVLSNQGALPLQTAYEACSTFPAISDMDHAADCWQLFKAQRVKDQSLQAITGQNLCPTGLDVKDIYDSLSHDYCHKEIGNLGTLAVQLCLSSHVHPAAQENVLTSVPPSEGSLQILDQWDLEAPADSYQWSSAPRIVDLNQEKAKKRRATAQNPPESFTSEQASPQQLRSSQVSHRTTSKQSATKKPTKRRIPGFT